MAKSDLSIADRAKSDVSGDQFTQLLQKKLLSQSDAVSSFDTDIESAINGAIKGVQQSGADTNARTASEFDRNIGYTKEAGAQKFSDAQEGQRGYGMQVQALRSLTDSTEKDVKDLEQRKQEAMLLGDSQTASKVADLQMQSLQYKQKAQQDVFDNLLKLSSYGISLRQEDRADETFGLQKDQFGLQTKQFNLQTRQQDFFEKNTMSQLAAQYGVELKEGDNIDTVTARIAPFASERQKLELEKIRADITNSKAQAAAAVKQTQDSSLPDSALAIIAEKWDTMDSDTRTSLLKNLTANDVTKVLGITDVVAEQRNSFLKTTLKDKSFKSADDAINYFKSLPNGGAVSEEDITTLWALDRAEKRGAKVGGGLFSTTGGDKKTKEQIQKGLESGDLKFGPDMKAFAPLLNVFKPLTS